MKVISKTFELDWRAVWGWKWKCSPKHRLRLQNSFFWTLEKADPEGWEKAWNPSGKEACVNSHQRRRNNFFFFFKYITLETAAPENRETATHHSGKGACVYATYRDRSVCAVACISRCITGSSSFRFLFALHCCLNHSLFYSENFVYVYVYGR